MVNIQHYENVVAYGIGEYFEKRKREKMKPYELIMFATKSGKTVV